MYTSVWIYVCVYLSIHTHKEREERLILRSWLTQLWKLTSLPFTEQASRLETPKNSVAVSSPKAVCRPEAIFPWGPLPGLWLQHIGHSSAQCLHWSFISSVPRLVLGNGSPCCWPHSRSPTTSTTVFSLKSPMMGLTEVGWLPYFLDYKAHFPPQIWEENGGPSYSPNVAYLARWGCEAVVEWGFFFSYFPPLKPRCVLWSDASSSPKIQYFLLSWCLESFPSLVAAIW